MLLRASEWLAVSYFLYLALCAGILPSTSTRTRTRRILTAAGALGSMLLVIRLAGIAQLDHLGNAGERAGMLAVMRDWAPAVYLLLGYWLPAGIAASPNPAVETQFLGWDFRLRALWHGDGPLRSLNRSATRVVAEIVYPLVHLMVPAGFVMIRYWLAPAAADRFWISVLAAGYVCYGTLPWLHLRPPRRLGLDSPAGATAPSHPPSHARMHGHLRRFNEWFLETTSVGASTFPSGHVATASSAALMVTAASAVAGAPMLLLTALIAIATVVGKYHYAVDALAGLLAGTAGWLLGRLISLI